MSRETNGDVPAGEAVAGEVPAGEVGADEPGPVRPYTLTGGRTRPSFPDLPYEALVEALAHPPAGTGPEKRRILELSSGRYLSVAELSAHTRLPVGVVRVLVGDLSDELLVRVHGLTGPALSMLERVLDGISAL